jgi:chemotaxis protein histidine kinase CheA
MNDKQTGGDQTHELIKAPNKLSDKVSVGGPGAVDPAMLEQAEKVIEDLADSYLDWVAEDLAKLQSAFAKLKADGGASAENLEAVFQVTHDIKGQGGSFDYTLMTIIGNQLCRFIENLDKKSVGAPELEVIELHVNTLQVVISQQLIGDGGEIGAKLLSGLEKVIAKRSEA